MAGQQVSAETALPLFRQRCSELQDENILLRAHSLKLEEQLAAARQELEQLRAQPPAGQAPQPLSCVDPDALP
ncbi:hypothetical protein ACH5A3_21455 [Streptomyces echinatus]|uniref:hypothetical protein n=1 Tax=Streptomyces echinatus TaxID=67293 RepID=UPI0037941742